MCLGLGVGVGVWGLVFNVWGFCGITGALCWGVLLEFSCYLAVWDILVWGCCFFIRRPICVVGFVRCLLGCRCCLFRSGGCMGGLFTRV